MYLLFTLAWLPLYTLLVMHATRVSAEEEVLRDNLHFQTLCEYEIEEQEEAAHHEMKERDNSGKVGTAVAFGKLCVASLSFDLL